MSSGHNPNGQNPAVVLGDSSVNFSESSLIDQAQPAQLDLQLAAHVRRKVNFEFDRISAFFRAAIDRQSNAQKRAEIEVALAFFEAKRGETLRLEQLRYFLQDRDVVDEQTGRVIANDVRYQAINCIQTVRRAPVRAARLSAAAGWAAPPG